MTKENNLYKERLQIYVALEDLDFIWCGKTEIPVFEELWNEGATFEDICHYFDRPEEEIACLVMDRAMKGKIEPRKGGLLGL